MTTDRSERIKAIPVHSKLDRKMTLPNPQYDARAKDLKARIYRLYGHGGITHIANLIGRSPQYLKHILAGRGTSGKLLDEIESEVSKRENKWNVPKA